MANATDFTDSNKDSATAYLAVSCLQILTTTKTKADN